MTPLLPGAVDYRPAAWVGRDWPRGATFAEPAPALAGFDASATIRTTPLADHADIFARLKQDHDLHRDLFERLEAEGSGRVREALFERLTRELKAHAAAEEQALYATMLRKPQTTEETRHSVAEHKEIEDLLNDLAATDMADGEWETKFAHLQHRYTHHIDEEEQDHFPDFGQYLDEADVQFMRAVFDRRKQAERAEAEVTPELLDDAKE